MIQLQCSIQEKRGYKRILFLQWYHLAKNLVDMTGENAYTRVLTTYDSRGEELWMFQLNLLKLIQCKSVLCVTTWFISTMQMRYFRHFRCLFNLASINFAMIGFHGLQCPFCQMKFIFLSKFIAPYRRS